MDVISRLQPHTVRIYGLQDRQFTLERVPAKSLLSGLKFDLFAKLYYIAHRREDPEGALKLYLEHIYVTGLVSEYTAEGIPHGLCRAKKLWYVTTAGGPYMPDFSYAYLSTLARDYFGIPETELIKAEMLDVVGFDAEAIVAREIGRIRTRES